MVWVNFSTDPTPVETKTSKAKADTGKLSVSNLKVTGHAVNTDGTVSLDPALDLGFTWDSTYDGATISQYTNKNRTGETLSYTWTLKDSKTLWELTQAYGKPGEGVTKDDGTCFDKQLYDASGKALQVAGVDNKDWTCNYTSLPGGITLVADTKYTFEVTAFDGTNSVKTSTDFTTEKVAAGKKEIATSAISVKLSANTAKAQEVKQDAKGVSFATFEITANEDVNVGQLVFGRKVEKNLIEGGQEKENFLSAAVDLVIGTGAKDTQKLSLTFPSTLDVKKDLKKGETLTVEVKADVAGNAYVDSTYIVSLEEVTFTGANKTAVTEKPALKGEMTTVISK